MAKVSGNKSHLPTFDPKEWLKPAEVNKDKKSKIYSVSNPVLKAFFGWGYTGENDVAKHFI